MTTPTTATAQAAPSVPADSVATHVTLRDATWLDIATLTRLDAELFEHEAWSERTWWDEFAARPRRQYVVAERHEGESQPVRADVDGAVSGSRTPDGHQHEARRLNAQSTGASTTDAHRSDATTIVGYAGLDAAGSTADVMTIAVTPDARGTGLGRRLLDHLIDAARASGAEALLLEVRADNSPALRLYERAGFDRISVRRRYYQPGDVDAVIMRKLLKGTS